MADLIDRYFDTLEEAPLPPLLSKFDGVIRFDIAADSDIGYWTVSIRCGGVKLSMGEFPADCVFRTDRELFNRILGREESLIASFLRGDLTIQGDLHIMFLIERLLPASEDWASASRGG